MIQSLFMRLNDEPPPRGEQEAYCDRLREIVAGGGRIKLVQIHTIARRPTESFASPLENAEVDALTELVRKRTGLWWQGITGAGSESGTTVGRVGAVRDNPVRSATAGPSPAIPSAPRKTEFIPFTV